MTESTQELLALAIVAGVVAIAIWRGRRKPADSGCGSCDAKTKEPAAESTIRFYRREDSDAKK